MHEEMSIRDRTPGRRITKVEGDCFRCQKCIDTCPKKHIHTGIKGLKGNEFWFYDFRAILLLCNYDLGRSVIDEEKDLFLGGGILFAACVLFLVMNLMQYVQAKESGQKENQEKQVVIKVDGEVYEDMLWMKIR